MAVLIEHLPQGHTDIGWAQEGGGCNFLATESQGTCFPDPSFSQLCWLFARRFSELRSHSGHFSPWWGAAGCVCVWGGSWDE